MRAKLLALVLLVVAAGAAGCLGEQEAPGDNPADEGPGYGGGAEGNGTAGDPADPGGNDTTAAPGPFGNLTWRADAAAPTPRTEVTAARLGSSFLVVGGYAESPGPEDAAAVPTVEVYDAASDAWFQAADYPMVIHHSAAITVAGTAYVFGGYTTSGFVPTDFAARYDAEADSWEPVSSLPTPRGAHGVGAVDGKAYLVGGVGPDGDLLPEVHVYDAAADTWTMAPPLPTPRDHLGVSAAAGEVHAVGGREQSFSTNQATLEVFDPEDGSWSTGPSMPTARGGVTASTYRDHVVVAGGEGSEGTFEEVEAYDVGNGTWRSLPPMPSPRHGLASGVSEDRFWTFLGGPEPGLTTSDAVESLG